MTVFRILIFCFKLAGEAASSLPCCLVLFKVNRNFFLEIPF
jgi:hypothetical protein